MPNLANILLIAVILSATESSPQHPVDSEILRKVLGIIFPDESPNNVRITTRNDPQNIFANAIAEATEFVDYTSRKYHNFSGSIGQHKGHGMEGHNYCKFTQLSEKIGRISNIHIKAFEILTQRHQKPKNQVIQYLSARLPSYCYPERQRVNCDRRARYRTINGSCNNLKNPYWGASYTEFDRLIPAAYDDGWNQPRGRGKGLPNPRVVSLSVHPDLVKPDNRITNMVPQFGQFLDHDMTLTPEADKHCCAEDAKNVDCSPIKIPPDDTFFAKLRSPQSCMSFTRSTPYCFPNSDGIREQMNIVTAFVDASHVYASENGRARLLRTFKNGHLRTNALNSNFLPTVEETRRITGEDFEFMGHFYGGEERVNEMPGLTVMHTLLFREHNRLADEISAKMPFWDDETIFQEARRLLVAQWQNIVYGEYLPIILGGSTMDRYGLTLGDSDYDPNMNPSIFHAFADAAYRFGHTLINGLIRMMRGHQEVHSYKLRDVFFNPTQITMFKGEGYDLILNGLFQQNAQTYDPFVTEDVTNFLLREKGHDHGSDLIARNLQRGRDHGLPGYDAYRKICGLPGLKPSWASGPPNIPPNVWKILRRLYQKPGSIDLFTGGLVEDPVPEAITGHTFNCLKAMQFARAKKGDRFFFTHRSGPAPFSREEITEIRKRTLGDIICDNSNIEMTSRNVFRIPSRENPMIYCNDPRRSRLNIDVFIKNDNYNKFEIIRVF